VCDIARPHYKLGYKINATGTKKPAIKPAHVALPSLEAD
jgi:hypothetical protein